VEEISAGDVARTVPVHGGEDPWMVNLDVDDDGRILGLEVLDAGKRLFVGAVELRGSGAVALAEEAVVFAAQAAILAPMASAGSGSAWA
jgi:hypothetical protein